MKLKGFYNPGLGAVVLLHIPIGAYYIYYIESMGLAGIPDWVVAFVYTVLVALVVVNKLTYSWLADKNSPYAFSEAEMKRFNVPRRLSRAHRQGVSGSTAQCDWFH